MTANVGGLELLHTHFQERSNLANGHWWHFSPVFTPGVFCGASLRWLGNRIHINPPVGCVSLSRFYPSPCFAELGLGAVFVLLPGLEAGVVRLMARGGFYRPH